VARQTRFRAEGFTPGIWLCPFGQSDQALFKVQRRPFVRRPDGTSIGENLTNPDTTGGERALHTGLGATS